MKHYIRITFLIFLLLASGCVSTSNLSALSEYDISENREFGVIIASAGRQERFIGGAPLAEYMIRNRQGAVVGLIQTEKYPEVAWKPNGELSERKVYGFVTIMRLPVGEYSVSEWTRSGGVVDGYQVAGKSDQSTVPFRFTFHVEPATVKYIGRFHIDLEENVRLQDRRERDIKVAMKKEEMIRGLPVKFELATDTQQDAAGNLR